MKTHFQKAGLALGLIFLLLSTVAFPNSFTWAQQDSGQIQTISGDEFTKSEGAKLFQEEKYAEAVSAFDELLKRYPKDPLIIRYKAIALDQMGKSKEAIKIFEDLLLEYPDHVPTHYFLGQAYARDGQQEKAAREWEWVASRGEGTPYIDWAQDSIDRFGTPAPSSRVNIRRWNFIGQYGYEYDSNVILRPSDGNAAADREKDGGRQTIDLGMRYRAYSKRDMAVDLLYTVRQSIHDHSLNEFNFHSQEFGINMRKRFELGGRSFVGGLRYEFLLGFLETDLFSVRNRWFLSAETKFTEHTRTVFYDRISQAQLGPDGTEPSKTSRDGLYNDLGVTQYFYNDDFSRYVFLRQELNTGLAQGSNFDSWGSTSRAGFFTPLTEKFDLETSLGLRLGFYPFFSSTSVIDQSRRRDAEWDLYTAVTYHLTRDLGFRIFYRYIGSNNQNNLFSYERQIGGAQAIYEFGA